MKNPKVVLANFGTKKWHAPLAAVMMGLLVAFVLIVFRAAPPHALPEKVATLVKVVPLHRQRVTAVVSGYGNVAPEQDLEVRPQVTGHIVELNADLQIGGRLAAGDVIAKIDPRDYEIAVETQRANVARAQYEYQVEQGNQVVAQKEWELLSSEIEASDLGKELALRKPQLREKQAALRAAKSQLQRAELDLERCTIRSPFAALVIEEDLEIGTFVSPQNVIAKLAGTDAFRVVVKVPRDQINFLTSEDINEQPLKVKITQPIGDGRSLHYQGEFVRVLGEVEALGRMAQVLVRIPAPLEHDQHQVPLLLGAYVQVEIPGRQIDQVFSVPRPALREGNAIWIVGKNQQLEIVPVDLVYSEPQNVFVRASLADGVLVIISPMQNALQGTLLKVIGNSNQSVNS